MVGQHQRHARQMQDVRVVQQSGYLGRVAQAGALQEGLRGFGGVLAPVVAVEGQAILELPAILGAGLIGAAAAPGCSDLVEHLLQQALIDLGIGCRCR